MKNFYAMQRANGDWFALSEGDRLMMPVFGSAGAAMTARSRDWGMECFRPVALDAGILGKLKITDGDTASFLIVSEPLRKLKHARRIGFAELTHLLADEKVKI